MCDINKKTDLKEVTVYKVAILKDEKYLSYFAKTPLKVGEVPIYDLYGDNGPIGNYISTCNTNPNMIGRVSGFRNISDGLIKFINGDKMIWSNRIIVLLELVISGDIMEGTAANISSEIDASEIVYAGTYVKSIKLLEN